MRIRSIKPEFWRDEVTGELPCDVALLFVGLWGYADDAGRFVYDPRLIRADLDPFGTKWGNGLAEALDALVKAGRIVLYDVGGRKYGHIPSFRKHQKISKPTPSRLPAPPELLPEDSRSPTGALPVGEDQGREQGAGSEEGRRRRPLDVLREEWDREYPATAALLRTLEAGGIPLNRPRKADVTQGIERSALKLGPSSAALVVREAYAVEANDALGWYAGALARAANGSTGKKANPLAAQPPARDYSGGF